MKEWIKAANQLNEGLFSDAPNAFERLVAILRQKDPKIDEQLTKLQEMEKKATPVVSYEDKIMYRPLNADITRFKYALPIFQKIVEHILHALPTYDKMKIDGLKKKLDKNNKIQKMFYDAIASMYDLMEKAPKGWEGTVKGMKKHKDITNPWALAHWMKNKGYKSHKGK